MDPKMPGSAIFIRVEVRGTNGGPHPRLLATDGPFNPCAPAAGWATFVGICPDLC
jgi:hypothetical protein